jgi:hypothetical protein
MSSLRSLIRKGRFFYDWPEDTRAKSAFGDLVRSTMTNLFEPDTILVNAQPVWDDIDPRTAGSVAENVERWQRAVDVAAVPKPKPPFKNMWLEATLAPDVPNGPVQHVGALVRRTEIGRGGHEAFVREYGFPVYADITKQFYEDKPACIVYCSVWHEWKGYAASSGWITYWLDDAGGFQWSVRQRGQDYGRDVLPSDEPGKWQYTILMLREGWILQTFARLNCRNVELRPIKEGKLQSHAPNKVRPATVWHEIVITSVPKMRSTGQDIFSDHEKSDIRAHWIRGHYADYRKGRGLFGNPKLKALFWIPEHRQGNEALGQVIPEYTLQ